jgi:hypothetical protein
LSSSKTTTTHRFVLIRLLVLGTISLLVYVFFFGFLVETSFPPSVGPDERQKQIYKILIAGNPVKRVKWNRPHVPRLPNAIMDPKSELETRWRDKTKTKKTPHRVAVVMMFDKKFQLGKHAVNLTGEYCKLWGHDFLWYHIERRKLHAASLEYYYDLHLNVLDLNYDKSGAKFSKAISSSVRINAEPLTQDKMKSLRHNGTFLNEGDITFVAGRGPPIPPSHENVSFFKSPKSIKFAFFHIAKGLLRINYDYVIYIDADAALVNTSMVMPFSEKSMVCGNEFPTYFSEFAMSSPCNLGFTMLRNTKFTWELLDAFENDKRCHTCRVGQCNSFLGFTDQACLDILLTTTYAHSVIDHFGFAYIQRSRRYFPLAPLLHLAGSAKTEIPRSVYLKNENPFLFPMPPPPPLNLETMVNRRGQFSSYRSLEDMLSKFTVPMTQTRLVKYRSPSHNGSIERKMDSDSGDPLIEGVLNASNTNSKAVRRKLRHVNSPPINFK